MKIKINQRKIVNQCTLLCYFLIILIVVLLILLFADEIFNWDILPNFAEKVGAFFLGACSLVIVASFLIALMVNMSIISASLEDIADSKRKEAGDE